MDGSNRRRSQGGGRAARLILGTGTALVLLVQGTGCAYQYRFTAERTASGQRVERWIHQGFYGWAGRGRFDLEEACPDGVSEFGSRVTFLNWLPALLTVGLYSPRTAFADCATSGGE